MAITRESLNFILQSASLQSLQDITQSIKEVFAMEVLLPPTQQMLLLPIKDPISTGVFYGGEVLVTTCIVCLSRDNTKAQGWAMILDDSPHYALEIATIDAYVGLQKQDTITKDILTLANVTLRQKQAQQASLNEEIDATRVQFELM